MKRSITISALLVASVLAVPALAEDTATTTTGSKVETDAGTTASTDAKANFGTVMSSIKAGKTNVSAISGMTNVSKVNIIRIGDLAKGNNMQAVEKAITDNQADIAGLQTAIGANTALKAKLDAQSIQASSVVAANVEADGSVTVYVK
jgi:hypothetical protein